jgi:hypothetical protein
VVVAAAGAVVPVLMVVLVPLLLGSDSSRQLAMNRADQAHHPHLIRNQILMSYRMASPVVQHQDS